MAAIMPTPINIDPLRLDNLCIAYVLQGGRKKPKITRIQPRPDALDLSPPTSLLPSAIHPEESRVRLPSYLPVLPMEIWDYIADLVQCKPRQLYRILSLVSRQFRTYFLPLFVDHVQVLVGHPDFEKRMSFISSTGVHPIIQQVTIRPFNFRLINATETLAHSAWGSVLQNLTELNLHSIKLRPQDLAALQGLRSLQKIRVSLCATTGFVDFDWATTIPNLPMSTIILSQIDDPSIVPLVLCLTIPTSFRNLTQENCRFTPSSISLPSHLTFPNIRIINLSESDIYALQSIQWSTVFPNLIAIQITGCTTPTPRHRSPINQFPVTTTPYCLSIPSLKAIFGVRDPTLLEALTSCDHLSHISLYAPTFGFDVSFTLIHMSTTLKSLSLTTSGINSILEHVIPELIALEALQIVFQQQSWYADAPKYCYNSLLNPSSTPLPRSIQKVTIQLYALEIEPAKWKSRLSDPLWRSRYPELRMICVLRDNWRELTDGKDPLIGYDFENHTEISGFVNVNKDEGGDGDGDRDREKEKDGTDRIDRKKIWKWIWRDEVNRQLDLESR